MSEFELDRKLNAAGEPLIVTQRDETGHIATVFLNRPEKLNAMNKVMWRDLGSHMAALSADESVRCVILRGSGEKAMGPGADISEFPTARSNSEQAAEYGALMHRTMTAIKDCPHPVIAQIHGLCIGGALEVASVCDIRICGTSSKFGIPVNKLGLVMAHAEIEGLIALVGQSTALEIVFEARIFDAAEAKDKGLVNRVVADADVAGEVQATAARIAAGAPLVNRWHKAFATRLADKTPLSEVEIAEGFACFDTGDFQTGYQAFLNKETPEFSGS